MEYDEVVIMPDHIRIKVEATTFKKIVITLLVIGAVLFLVIIVGGIFVSKSYFYFDLSDDNDKQPLPPPEYISFQKSMKLLEQKRDQDRTINENTGATDKPDGFFYHPANGGTITKEETCKESKNRIWRNGYCRCLTPFWGEECERETHSPNYYAVGNYNSPNKEISVPQKAFVRDSCEKLCDQDQKCLGYEYKNKTCKLLHEVPEGVSYYTHDEDANTFLKTIYRPSFPNEVYIHSKFLPRRFWLSRDHNVARCKINQATRIDWYPEGIINDPKATLVFSKDFFTLDDFKKNKKSFYVHRPDSLTKVPHEIVGTGKSYWIMPVMNA